MKLGFLFLCKNDINQLQLWLDFFKDNYDKCNIYIHSYDQINISQEFIKKYHIDKVLDTGWGDIYDVVRYVMNISIKNNDYKLILLSESTIPVKSFDYIYNYLTKDGKGYLNYDMTNEYTVNMQNKRYKNNCNNIKSFKENIDFKHWYFNEAWIIFNIEMIEIILNDDKYHLIFKNCFCPDENYPIYLYSLYNKLDLFYNIKTTFTNWDIIQQDESKYHPELFNHINEDLILKLSDPNILFARKFTNNPNIYKKGIKLFNPQPNKYEIYDMNDNRIDINNIEVVEQSLANEYIKENDIVLELGARYGSVSCIINSKLKNKNNQVVVEPDSRVWEALEKNKKINNCEFNIVKGFISNKKLDLTNLDNYGGYGSTYIENNNSKIPSYTLHEIKSKYNLNFNVLFADCEGFLEQFLNENSDILDNLRLIIFEKDYPDKCDYKKIKIQLQNKKFKQLLYGFHNVWIK
jgi:FkbM family methyltransferase